MKLLAKEGKETLGVIQKKWKLFLLLLVADAFFFYSYGFVSGGIFRKFADYMSAAAMHLTESAGEFGRGIVAFRVRVVRLAVRLRAAAVLR